MPRRRINHTEEVRLTLGNYERGAFKDAMRLNAAAKAAPALGMAAIGAGVAFAAFILSDLAGDFFDRFKNLLGGSTPETRGNVNRGVENNSSQDRFTPPDEQGSSPLAIYLQRRQDVDDILHIAYRQWLGTSPDNSANYSAFLGGQNIAFDWGGQSVKIQLQSVTGGEVSEETDTEYTGFAYQVTIREVASRRQAIHDANSWNPLARLFNNGFEAVSGLDWTSRFVSEAGGYISDPLLWCAWGRVDWYRIEGATKWDIGTTETRPEDSHYAYHLDRSLLWEAELKAAALAIRDGAAIDPAWLPQADPLP